MHEAEQERRRKILERIGYTVGLLMMAGMWIAGWMIR